MRRYYRGNPDDESRALERASEYDEAKLYHFNQQQRRLGILKTKVWNIFNVHFYPAFLGKIVLPDPVTKFDVIERIRQEKGWRTHAPDAEIISFGRDVDQRIVITAYMVCNYLEPAIDPQEVDPRPAKSSDKLLGWLATNYPCDPEKHWDSYRCLACVAVRELQRARIY